MKAFLALVLAATVASIPAPGVAGATGFALINNTAAALSGLEVRRTGSTDWRPLGPGLSVGARTRVSFSDPDCAFDLKAKLAGDGEATWRGVNLCEVSSVTLNRGSSGETWVDYD